MCLSWTTMTRLVPVKDLIRKGKRRKVSLPSNCKNLKSTTNSKVKSSIKQLNPKIYNLRKRSQWEEHSDMSCLSRSLRGRIEHFRNCKLQLNCSMKKKRKKNVKF